MTKFNKNIVCCLVVVLFSSAAFAGFADPTYRGTDNSVHAIYDLVDESTWDQTTFETGPSEYPLFQAAGNGSVNETFEDDFTKYMLQVPNFVDDLDVKHMRIQLTFNFEVSSEDISINDVFTSFTGPTQWAPVGGSVGISTEHFIDIDIWPNPDWEWIDLRWLHPVDGSAGGDSLGDPTVLTKIEIDTVSIPEPATIAILTLGSLGLIRKRLV